MKLVENVQNPKTIIVLIKLVFVSKQLIFKFYVHGHKRLETT